MLEWLLRALEEQISFWRTSWLKSILFYILAKATFFFRGKFQREVTDIKSIAKSFSRSLKKFSVVGQKLSCRCILVFWPVTALFQKTFSWSSWSLYEFDFVFSSTKFVYETLQAVLMRWIYPIFNPLTPTTSLVILFTLWHTIIMTSIWKFDIRSTTSMLYIVLKLKGEILSWSLVGGKGPGLIQ